MEIDLINQKVIAAYNELVAFENDNYDKITCVLYSRTLDYILKQKNYNDQIEAYIEQYREGYNSLDYNFYDSNISNGIYDELNTDEIPLIIRRIKKAVTQEEFYLALIGECLEYYDVNIEEQDI